MTSESLHRTFIFEDIPNRIEHTQHLHNTYTCRIMAMLKRLRRQFSGGHLGSNPRLAGSSSGRRLLPRLGSLNSLTSADGTAKKSRQAQKQPSQTNTGNDHLYTHDAAGRRTLDRLITTRQWDRIEELLSTDDGRDYNQVRLCAVG